jgi:hypothetical protein
MLAPPLLMIPSAGTASLDGAVLIAEKMAGDAAENAAWRWGGASVPEPPADTLV